MGTLSCLNVAGGDISVTFDASNAPEAIRAKRMIREMLSRGYALLVRMEDGTYQRAIDFDETKSEYIIADLDPTAQVVDAAQVELKAGGELEQTEKESPARPKARRGRRRGIAMEAADALAVARSAGG
jgi:hypothetical protein